jgi:chromosome segregation ATPase
MCKFFKIVKFNIFINQIVIFRAEMKEQRVHLDKKHITNLELVQQLNHIDFDKKTNDLIEKHKEEISDLKSTFEEQFKKQNNKIKADKSNQTDKQINSLEIELNETKCKLKDLESSANESIQNLNQLNDHLKNTIAHLKSEIKKINHKNEELQGELNEANKNKDQLVAGEDQKLMIIEKLKAELDEMHENRQSLEEEITLLEEQAYDAKILYEDLKIQNEGFLGREDLYQSQFNELSEQADEIEQLKGDLKELEISKEKLQANLRECQQMLSLSEKEKKNEIEQLKSDLKELGMSKEKLQVNLRECQQLLLQNEKENHADEMAAVKKPSKTKTISKSSKTSKSSIMSNEIIVEDDSEDHVIEEKKLRMVDTNSRASSMLVEESLVIVNETYDSDKHKTTVTTAAATRKKSTLNRLTEMISKSPILESVRNRPMRKPKAATISNAQDKEIIAAAIANDKKVRSVKGTTLATKKTSLLESLDKLGKHEELDNIFELDSDDESAAAKSKKKRVKK